MTGGALNDKGLIHCPFSHKKDKFSMNLYTPSGYLRQEYNPAKSDCQTKNKNFFANCPIK